MSGPSPEQKRQQDLLSERRHKEEPAQPTAEDPHDVDPGLGGRWRRLLVASGLLLVLAFMAAVVSALWVGPDVLQQISASAFLGVGGIWTLVFMQAWRG